MTKISTIGIGLALAVLSTSTFAQQQTPPQGPAAAGAGGRLAAMMAGPLTVTPLRGGVYWVSGGVPNTGFVVGDKGVVAIDAQMFAGTAKRELAEIAKITDKPVNAIILTHSDGDHVNGLPGFPLGMQIVAQENAKTEMLDALADPQPHGLPTPPELKDYIPTITVRDRKNLVLDGVRFELIHAAPAHTDGDLIIYLPDQKIVFAGDLVTPSMGAYPLIHLNKHGSSLGWIKSAKAILALDADTYISGHGDRLDKAQLRQRVADVEARRTRIEALVAEGKSLDDIKATFHDPAPPNAQAARFPSFTETVYQELTSK